jgi:ketosteroid isomerase-like protein
MVRYRRGFVGERSTRDVARELCQAYDRGSVDGVLALMDPDVVLVPLPLLAERPYVGHGGIRRFFAEAAREWDALRFTVHRVGVSGDRAALLGRYRAGRDGTLQDGRVAWVVDVADGRVTRSVTHPSWEAALAETGMDLADTEPLAV